MGFKMKKSGYYDRIQLRISHKQRKRCQEAADRRGISLSAFCRQSMLYFSDKILGESCEPDAKNNKSA
jgi:uncharacterized protein (DUF1778 family)